MPNPAIFSTKEKRVIEKVIRFKDLPYKPFRTKLYSVKELMAGYPRKTLDQRIAEHYKAHNNQAYASDCSSDCLSRHAFERTGLRCGFETALLKPLFSNCHGPDRLRQRSCPTAWFLPDYPEGV